MCSQIRLPVDTTQEVFLNDAVDVLEKLREAVPVAHRQHHEQGNRKLRLIKFDGVQTRTRPPTCFVKIGGGTERVVPDKVFAYHTFIIRGVARGRS